MTNEIDWRWLSDVDSNNLVLLLTDEIHFQTALSLNQSLLSSELEAFTTEDAKVYSAFREKLQELNINEQDQFSIAVNATAACNYQTTLATKSWYFLPQERNFNELFGGDIVIAEAKKQCYYIVLDSDEVTSTIMLISHQHPIDEGRSFYQGDTIKVHNDRLLKVVNLQGVVL